MNFTTSLSLLEWTGTGINLSKSNLSPSVFRLAKFYFSVKLVVSIPVASFNSNFVA